MQLWRHSTRQKGHAASTIDTQGHWTIEYFIDCGDAVIKESRDVVKTLVRREGDARNIAGSVKHDLSDRGSVLRVEPVSTGFCLHIETTRGSKRVAATMTNTALTHQPLLTECPDQKRARVPTTPADTILIIGITKRLQTLLGYETPK